jgi:hypothetical protein
MAEARLKLVSPTTEKRTVALRRAQNAAPRTREHLTEMDEFLLRLKLAHRSENYLGLALVETHAPPDLNYLAA